MRCPSFHCLRNGSGVKRGVETRVLPRQRPLIWYVYKKKKGGGAIHQVNLDSEVDWDLKLCILWIRAPNIDMVVLILLQCNNPLTKEPKLDRARRQIKEWEDLDNEATEFAKQVNAQLKAARPQQQQQQPKEDVPKPSEAGKQEQDIPKKDEL